MDGGHDPLSDAALDRELDAALNVEPSPEFVASVRIHVAAQAVPHGWRPGWWTAGGAVTVAAVAIAVLLPGWRMAQPIPERESGVVEPSPQQVSRDVSTPPRVAPSPASELEPAPREPAAETSTRQAVHNAIEDAPPFSDVLVSRDEQRAFEELVVAARRGSVPAFAAEPDLNNPFGIAQIEIEPLTLTDLSLDQRAEGEERP